MANRPYQEKVDQFMADYQDKFLPTLVTGKGTDYRPPVPDLVGQRMDKTQAQLERDKMLAASIHPDTFGKVLDVMSGKGTPGSPFTNLSGPVEALAGDFGGAGTPISLKNLYNQWQESRGFPKSVVAPTGGGLLADLKAAIPNELLRGGGGVVGGAEVPSDLSVAELLRSKGLPISGVKEAEKPVPAGGWDWRGELAKQGTWSVGPERFFAGGKEVPAGTPGAVTGDQLARERIAREGGSAIPLSAMGEAPIPTGRAPEVPGYEMPGEIRTALQGIQKILMRPTERPWSPRGYLGKEGGYSKAKLGTLENLAGTLEKMAATGAGYQTKMAEIGAEKPYREAMADYYRRMAGVHETALPSEAFARYGAGMHALSEAERPYAFPPNSAVYQGAKLLGYVPEKPEAIHPIIRDVINKSQMVDPTTGQQTGFDIRGARQKIGFMAPWLKAQGIDVPKESYKMTKPEFLAEQKAFVSRLPKKERKKYTEQYLQKDWEGYWGKD